MHDHAHDGIRGASNKKLLAISLAITGSIMVVQIIGAVISGSLALIADAAHMFADTSALIIALIASIVAQRPADARRTFGYQRAEVFGALINGVLLAALAIWVGYEGIQRLINPSEHEVAGGLMLIVAIVGALANLASMFLLSKAQKTSINVRGAYLEVMGDMIGSVGVIIAAIIIVTTGWMPADAIASLFIAVMIVPRAIVLLREVTSVLSEAAPKGMSADDIREHLSQYEGVRAVHDVHIWQLTRGAPVFSAHIVVDPELFERGESARLLSKLQSCLATHFDVEHSTFQLEPAGHGEDADALHH